MHWPALGCRALSDDLTDRPRRGPGRLSPAARLAALRAWSPAPVPRASLWLHGVAALGIVAEPQHWPQMLAVLAGNHAVLGALMHPRSTQLGPNLVALPGTMGKAVALTFDDGPDPEVTPRVLDLLDRHGATASFFVIGRKAARHGALLREIGRRGHTIENHSYHHAKSFACRGPWALRREVVLTQRAVAEATGVAPRFFRAPMGLRSPLLDPVLALEGLQLVSWTRRGYDGRGDDPGRVLDRLTRGLAARDILLLHDGTPGTRPRGEAAVLAVLPPLLARCAAAGLRVGSLAPVAARASPAAAVGR